VALPASAVERAALSHAEQAVFFAAWISALLYVFRGGGTTSMVCCAGVTGLVSVMMAAAVARTAIVSALAAATIPVRRRGRR
jgi:hypothetical protein